MTLCTPTPPHPVNLWVPRTSYRACQIAFFVCLFVFNFLAYHAACGILVPQPGIEPRPPAVEARSLNHWTTGEIPRACRIVE